MATIKNPLTIVQGGGPAGSWGSIKYTIDGVTKEYELKNETEFMELVFTQTGERFNLNGDHISSAQLKEVEVADGVQFIPSNFCFQANNLEKITLPSTVTYIGDYCFSQCYKVNYPINLENVNYIGASFLNYNAIFNQPVSLPNVKEIGSGFFMNNTAFNSPITINDGVLRIGASFLRGCTSFAQSLTIPSGLEYRYPSSTALGQYFLYQCNNFVGPLICNGPTADSEVVLGADTTTLSTNKSDALMYTTGITLTGPYAQTWKDAFPDRTSSPYRKLIVES